jgi:hypothetical protein
MNLSVVAEKPVLVELERVVVVVQWKPSGMRVHFQEELAALVGVELEVGAEWPGLFEMVL